MKVFIRKLNSKGDTIIEILLAIAVLSLVLSVSYGLSNRSSQAVRQAQERGEAQKLAEEQLELLRGYYSPDQPWESQCFNDAGDPTDNAAADCNNRGPGNRYNIRVVPSGENTFTVYMDWTNVKGGTDELTLSNKLPVTGDIPPTDNFQCGDDEDNGPIFDGVKDADDPDCKPGGVYDPTIEPEDPLPPPDTDGDGIADDDDACINTPGVPAYDGCPPPFEWEDDGRGYDFCVPDRTLYTPFGDGHDGCLRTGDSMYAYRPFNAVYNMGNGLKRGNATITICYRNHGNSQPTGYSQYLLEATVGHGTTKQISLPFPSPPQTQVCHDNSIYIDQVNPQTLRLIWFNDNWTGGDANLRIDSVKITQEYTEGSSPVDQMIYGENFTSCQINGSSHYCLLDDIQYTRSVYSLSSDPATPSKSTYKFNSSITPGSYDLSITYFNGNNGENLPAPPSYNYNITVNYPGGNRTVNMSIENNLHSRHIRQSVINNINITGGSPMITIQWNNDLYNPGVYDANFGINSVLLTKR